MRRSLLFSAFLVMISGQFAAATESGSIRCAGGLVSVGDTAGELVAKCGEPAYKTQREQKMVETVAGTRDRVVTAVTVDDWTFNFGPDQFQYQVLLENGRVARIESLDYGY